MRRTRIIAGSVVATGLLVATAIAGTLTLPTGTDFASTEDTSASDNISSSAATGSSGQITLGDATPLRGGYYHAPLGSSGYGQPELQLEKDDATFFSSQDNCVPALAGFNDGTYDHPDQWRVGGTTDWFRTGPQVASNVSDTVAATLPPSAGTFDVPPGVAATGLKFLTGGSSAAPADTGNPGDAPADYTIQWTCSSGTAADTVVTIAGMSSSTRPSTGTDYTVSAGDTFTAASTPAVPSNCTFDPVYLDQVDVTVPSCSSGGVVTAANITYNATELGGPVAASWVASQVDFGAYFQNTDTGTPTNKAHYKGKYVSQSDVLNATDNAIWYQVGWQALLEDTGANNTFRGDVFLKVECGTGGTWTTGFTSHYDTGDTAPPVPLASTHSEAMTNCEGPSIRYRVDIVTYEGTAPSLDSLTFDYDVDHDRDHYSVNGYTPSGGSIPGTGDCDDNDATINPGVADTVANDVDENCDGQLLCYDDADSDTFGAATTNTNVSAPGTCASPSNHAANNDTDCNDTASSCTNDCSTDTDGDSTPDCLDQCDDGDGDTYGITRDLSTCTTDGSTHNCALTNQCAGTDCLDSGSAGSVPAAQIHPNATEIVGNDVNENCDTHLTCFDDMDRDTYGAPSTSNTRVTLSGTTAQEIGVTCASPSDQAADNTNDCNDAASSCTNDCSTNLDGDSAPDCIDRCIDYDHDNYGTTNDQTYGNATDSVGSCTQDGSATCTYQDAACDGTVDQSSNFPNARGTDVDDTATSCTDDGTNADGDTVLDCRDRCRDSDHDTYGLDNDSNTYGTGAVAVSACKVVAGGATCTLNSACTPGGDCYDNASSQGTLTDLAGNTVNPATVHPGATDDCGDGVDNDCTESTMCTDFPCTAATPASLDDDGDGVSNITERDTAIPGHSTGTDVCRVDTDGDGLCDGSNTIAGTCVGNDPDPLDADSDDDGLKDGYEAAGEDASGSATGFGATDPTDHDGDADGLTDGVEVRVTTAVSNGTTNSCSYTWCKRFFQGTDTSATWWETDHDTGTRTDPNEPDTDQDNLCDGPDNAGGACNTNPGEVGEDQNRDGAVDATETDPNKVDTDADGICDGPYQGSSRVSCAGSEFVAGTLGYNEDTDGDGLKDGDEDPRGISPSDAQFGQAGLVESDPTKKDSDSDGICDGNVGVSGCVGGEGLSGTDPLESDTDGDGLTDHQEDPSGDGSNTNSDPLKYDTDLDGIKDSSETGGLNVLKADTDDDGIKDGVEDDSLVSIVANSTTPNGIGVAGNSGFTHDADTTTKTDPTNPDTDGDGLCDGNLTGGGTCASGEDLDDNGAVGGSQGACTESDPRDADSDEDGISDGQEADWGTAKLTWDSDGDGLSDGQEMGFDTGSAQAPGGTSYPYFGTETSSLTNSFCGTKLFKADANSTHDTDPMDIDTDNDNLCDGIGTPAPTGCTGGEDRDDSGAITGDETNPADADSDDDGLSDGVEDSNGNGYEIATETDANNADTDGDGLDDGRESGVTAFEGYHSGTSASTNPDVQIGYAGTTNASTTPPFRPLNPDGDNNQNSDPIDADSDGDGLCDGNTAVTSATFGTCTAGEDMNADGVVDAAESNPLDADSDEDGLNDGEEGVGVAGYDPTDKLDDDSDDDGLTDGLEVGRGTAVANGTSHGGISFTGTGTWTPDSDTNTTTDPNNPDTDGDDLCDGPNATSVSCDAGFDHLGEDRNKDGAWDDANETDPNSHDTDGDGLSDGEEEIYVCDAGHQRDSSHCSSPLLGKTDTDGDGVDDATEALDECDPEAASARDGAVVSGLFPNRVITPADCDDGSGNSIDVWDTDDDGDGVPTGCEDWTDVSGTRFNTNNYLNHRCLDDHGNGVRTDDDRDGDGVADYLDVDDDGDTLLTSAELTSTDGCVPASGFTGNVEDHDQDDDSWPDYVDADDDNDFSTAVRTHYGITDPTDPAYTAPTKFEVAPRYGTNHCFPDTDGDGVVDGTEFGPHPNVDTPMVIPPQDTDGDGTIDARDDDDDGDNIATSDEDDGTGLQNLDSPSLQACTDLPTDDIPNYLDSDSDNDGYCDGFAFEALPGQNPCIAWDCGSSSPTICPQNSTDDADRTGDGVFIFEGFGTDLIGDADSDGIPNIWDCNDLVGGCSPLDTDVDGLTTCEEQSLCMPNDCQTGVDGVPPDSGGCCLNPQNVDTDGDCVNDGDELASDGTLRDTDRDTYPNAFDQDDDQDGVPTNIEYYDLDEQHHLRVDAQGHLRHLDPNTCNPAANNDSYIGPEDMDTDGDGIADYLDPDDDGDGIPTSMEACAPRPGEDVSWENCDNDDDGLPDYLDAVPDGRCGDLDGDGINNNLEDSLGLDQATIDSDGDGVPDSVELWQSGPCVAPNAEPTNFDAATCGPSYDDVCVTEACGCGDAPNTDGDDKIDALDPDDDGDGIPTIVEGTSDFDGDGTPNYLDTDSDGDGISDHDEGGATWQSTQSLPDSDGDGAPDFLDTTNDSFDSGGPHDSNPELPGPGCACSSTSPSLPTNGGTWTLLLAAGLLVRRRRRRKA